MLTLSRHHSMLTIDNIIFGSRSMFTVISKNFTAISTQMYFFTCLGTCKIVYVMILGRTDLKISLSWAKFDAEADFDVRFAVARQNPRQIGKKAKIFVRNFHQKKIFGVEKRNVRNWLKRVLAKFRAVPSQVWRVNGRSKFVSAVAKGLKTLTRR